MKGLIEGYTHHTGVHCISSSLSNVFRFNGFDLSEEMVFGLGDGIGLAYTKMLSGTPVLSGYGYQFEDRMCKRLGVKLNKWKSKNAEKGWERLKARLEQGKPSMIMIDMAFLDYGELPEDFHFGQHGVVVCGYDPENDTVLISDTEFKEPQVQSVDSLKKGRSFQYNKWMDSNNQINEFTFPKKQLDLRKYIPDAVNKAGKNVFATSIMEKMMGVKGSFGGVDTFIKEVVTWDKMPEDKLVEHAMMFNLFVSDSGTGGASFRYLYSRFLKEAGEIMEDNQLQELSTHYKKTGDIWEEISMAMKEVSQDTSKTGVLKETANTAARLKEMEREGATRLKEYKPA